MELRYLTHFLENFSAINTTLLYFAKLLRHSFCHFFDDFYSPNLYSSKMKNLPLLGGITAAHFLRDYWQKKPLLVRQAIPQFIPFLSRKQLFAMAANDEVESRLVSQIDGQWQMQHGPLSTLPSVKQDAWTILLQGVNLHNDEADALLRQFRFINDARLDDLMISYASNGGGVGAHFDSYDVFLLQAHGQRRWRISEQQDLSLIEGLPLKILRNFEHEEEFILEPGDMLYLPPHYAHEGVAIGECMTYSIGFRAPSFQELGENFLHFMVDSIDLPGRYTDPDLKVTQHPAEISKQMLNRIADEINKVQFTAEDILVFLGQYMSEPKSQVFFDTPKKPLSAERFAKAAAERGLILSRKTQMLYYEDTVFVNGESFEITAADQCIVSLANERRLAGVALADASSDVAEAFYTWYQDGWIQLA